jgi:thiol-disulfide isomerase/thioredoxin
MGTKAPNLHISEWVQGLPTNIDKNIGKVVLVEVFQVNCPGCFMYALPNAIEIYKNNSRDDVVVLGLATAFEDYDKNTLENLKLLLSSGKVIGETFNALSQYGQLIDGDKINYKITFPVFLIRTLLILLNPILTTIIPIVSQIRHYYLSESNNISRIKNILL